MFPYLRHFFKNVRRDRQFKQLTMFNDTATFSTSVCQSINLRKNEDSSRILPLRYRSTKQMYSKQYQKIAIVKESASTKCCTAMAASQLNFRSTGFKKVIKTEFKC